MADLLNATQQNQLRADGHKSKFYLSVARPVVVLTCLVNNASIERGATAIAVDNGTAADLGAVKAGMTLAVTTSTGVWRVRIASVSLSGSSPNIAGTITVDTNPIVWGNNQAITVYSLFEPWAIMPTFNATTGVSTKRGQTFSNQTKFPGPIAQAGPHRPGFVEDGSLVFNLSAANMVLTPGASISSHAWETTIGTLSADDIANPTLTVTEPGEGWLFYTSTDSNGKTHTAIRHVWAHSTDPDDSDYPYADFEANNLSLSFSGGYRASIKVSGVADFNQFFDGALVCIWKETWYGSTKTHISLNEDAEGQLFVGYIVKDTILTDPVHGSVTFEVQTLGDISKSLAMQALSIHAEAVVQYWFQMPTWMTMKHMLHWLLHWHSNVLELADWDITTNTKKKKLFTFNDGNLGSQAADIASKLVAQIGCNKAGQMFVEENVQFLSASARAAMDTVMDVTRADWRMERTIVRRPYPVTAYIELKGYSFDGTNVVPYCSVAPTRIRANRGSKKNYDGMIVSNQADANFLAGRFYAVDNNPIEEIRVPFAGDYSVVDVFPQRWYTTTVTSDDTLRGVTYTDIRMVPRSVSLQLNTKEGVCLVDAVFEAEAFGPDGIAVTCPSSGQTPTGPDPTWPVTPSTSGGGGSLTALAAGQSVDYRDSNASDWTQWAEEAISNLTVDRFWKTKAGSVAPDAAIVWIGATGSIRRVTKTEVSDRTPAEDPPDSWADTVPPTVGAINFSQVVTDPFVQSRLHALATWTNADTFQRAWLLRSEDEGATWEYLDLWTTSAPDKLTALWLAVNASHVLVTTWEERSFNGKLMLRQYDIATGDYVAETEIQECAQTELGDNTYLAYPVTVLDDDDLWYIAGRMGNPFDLAGGIYHVIKTTDAGDTWESYEAGWGTDLCSALFVDSPASGDRTHYAVRGPGNASYTPLALGPGTAVAIAEMTADRAIVYYVGMATSFPYDGTLALLDTSTEPPTVLDTVIMPGGNLDRTYVSISKIDDNFALVGSRVYDTMGLHTTSAEAAIVEITGALDDALTLGALAGVLCDPSNVTVAALSTTKGVITFEDGGQGKGAVLDLDTTTRAVTFNATQTFQASGCIWPSCCKIDATTALVVYTLNSDLLFYANVLDAIGTSWTLGADTLVSAEGDITNVFDSGSINSQLVDYLEDGAALTVYQVRVDLGGDYAYIIRSRKLTVAGSGVSVGGASNVSSAGIDTYDWNPVVRGAGASQAYCLYVRSIGVNNNLYRANLSDLGIVQSTHFVHGAVSYASVHGSMIAYSDETPSPDQVYAVRF